MSKLQDLMRELCPDGVEYKKLGDFCEIKTGKGVTKADAVLGGIYPIISGGQSPMGYYHTFNRKANTVTISRVGAYAGFVNYIKEPFYLNDKCFSVIPMSEKVSTIFLFYVLKNMESRIKELQSEGGVPTINTTKVSNLEIPLPPLEVQEEIVRILDHFTDLAAELQAELQARKEQYEYYRNQLLTFNKIGGGTQNVTWMKMSEICLNITSGGTPNTSKKEYYIGNIPWLRTQEVNWHDIFDTDMKISEEGLKSSSTKMIPINCVIVAMYGATAAKVAINKIPLCTNQACCNLEINPQKAHYRFVYQWLCKEYGNLKTKGEGSQHNINSKKIKNYLIPVPSLAEQERIVTILDRFERLTTDLQTGLPAEIAAVQEQYEYYRNKILSFPRIKIGA